MGYRYNSYTIDGETPTADQMLDRVIEDMTLKVVIVADHEVVTGYHWNSSGNVVPPDYLYFAFEGRNGQDRIVAQQEKVSEHQAKIAIAAYRARQANRTDEEKAEHEFELRAAFGEGATVVDVLSGERVQL